MAASAEKNPKSRLLMPVIIPAAPSQSYALTSNLKCNDKRGALEERTPRFIQGGLSVFGRQAGFSPGSRTADCEFARMP